MINLKNKKICIVVALNCPYGGNIIPSLKALAEMLTSEYGATVSWIFPIQPMHTWLKELKEYYDVAFISSSYKKSTSELKKIFKRWKPDIVHTHYEAYDIPVSKAINRKTHMVWHIHDHMSLDTTGQTLGWLRKLKRSILFSIHYGLFGRNAELLSVSNEMAVFCGHYKTHFFSYPPSYTNEKLKDIVIPHVTTLINGVEFSRLMMLPNVSHWDVTTDPFTFLSYGGQNIHKHVEYLVKAGLYMANKGLNFHIIITKGADTESVVHSVVGRNLPEWLELAEQTDKIVNYLARSACYVSTSIHETMSTAIAEATLYGLPVIQSDIPGTYWNANNPSTFLFRSEDVEDLAKKMEEVMNADYDKLKEACDVTKQINRQRLSLGTWCNGVISCYKKL